MQIEGGKVETVTNFIFLGSQITVDGDCSHEIKRHSLLQWKAMTNPDNILKYRDITAVKDLYSHSYDLSNSHVWMWEFDLYNEGWMMKNWCFQSVVPKKTERVTGREARVLQTEEIGFKCQTCFYLSLEWQEETNYKCQIFFFFSFSIQN